MILPQLTQCMGKTKPWPTQGFDENPYEPTRNLHDSRFYSHFNIFQWQSWYSAEILVFFILANNTPQPILQGATAFFVVVSGRGSARVQTAQEQRHPRVSQQ